MLRTPQALALTFTFLGLVSCGGPSEPLDAGGSPRDVGPVTVDAAPMPQDSGPVTVDAAPMPRDSGPVAQDTGPVRADAGPCGECLPGAAEERACDCGTGTQRRTCTDLCEFPDWGACEGGEGYPRDPATDEERCPPYNRPAVFMAAHQDDESIGMAGAIVEHVQAGRDVFLELMTRGQASGARIPLNNGGTHEWHPGRHEYDLSREEFGDARVREFLSAAQELGVLGVRLNDFGDGDLTTAEVRTRIDFWTANGGEELSLKGTAGDDDPTSAGGSPHRDHDAVWDALVESGFGDVRAYLIYHYTSNGGSRFGAVSLTADQCAAKGRALAQYQLWDPAAGRYAVGYHSVGSLIDAARGDCREFIVRP